MLAGQVIGIAVAMAHDDVDVPVAVDKVGDDEDVRTVIELPVMEFGVAVEIGEEADEGFEVDGLLVVVYAPTVPLLEIHVVVRTVVEVAGHVL